MWRVPATGEPQRRFYSSRHGRIDGWGLDPPFLQEYLDRILPSLTESVWHRFYRCGRRQQHIIVGQMSGYELGWKWCPWSSDEFMEMLLDNTARRYPQVWQSTWVAGRLPEQVTVLPGVPEWLQT